MDDDEIQSPVMRFIESQLPFLAKLINKFKKNSNTSPMQIEMDDDDDEEESESGFKKFVDSQLPFLAKFLNKSKPKSKPKSKSKTKAKNDEFEDDIDEIMDEQDLTGDIDISGLDDSTSDHENELISAIENTDQIELDANGTGKIELDESFIDEEDEEFLDEEDEDATIELEESDDEDEDEEEDLGFKDKILAALPGGLKNLSFLQKKKSVSDDYEDDEDDEDKGKKKKFQLKPVHLIVILALAAIMFVDLEENQDNVAKEDTTKVKKERPKNNIKNSKEDTETQEKVPEDKKVVETPTSEVKEEPIVKEDQVKPTESDEIKDLFVDDSLELPKDEPKETNNEELVPENNLPSIGETSLQDTVPDLGTELINDDSGSAISEEVLKDLEEKVKSQEEIQNTVKLMQPVAPPDYEEIGRGLVYNCVGKHWACVDDSSYQTCVQNNQWNTQNNLKVQCYAYEVYNEEADCSQMQQYQIDSIAPTDFCN